MISVKAALGYVLLLATAARVSAFDASKCTQFVFRSSENALWHCGEPLPGEPDNQWTARYCDHSSGGTVTPFAWASDHPNDWCAFMIATVRQSNEDHFPLTPEVDITDTPGPNVWFLRTLVEWSCYVVENDVTVEAYHVDSAAGEHASTVTEQCERTQNYFDYWVLFPAIQNLGWHTDGRSWYPGYTGPIPDNDYSPTASRWGRCHYDNAMKSPHYVPELGVEYAECAPGYVCELKYQDYAACFPDPDADHECCVSWHQKCEKKGDCCAGSECNDSGFCDTEIPQEFEEPPGICTSRGVKTEKKLYSRCFDYGNGQGDCSKGYLCVGTSWLAHCEINESVKDDYCMWKYETGSRPGDCCLGWYSHCNTYDPNDPRKCIDSMCVPGREEGVDEFGNPMTDVHDRLKTDPPPLASYYEVVGDCTGAICGVWGDPHVVTCDDLKYDCQALGLFTLIKNHMFNVQAYFKSFDAPWGVASITTDVAIDYTKDAPNGVPTMQFSFPRFEDYPVGTTTFDQADDSNARQIGPCPVKMYIDGQVVDISNVPEDGYLYGDENSDASARLFGYGEIDIKHLAGVDIWGEKYYSESRIWIHGGGPFSDWSCILTFYMCLPGHEKEQFETTSVGLWGTPDGKTENDWVGPDGQTLLIPDLNRDEAAFSYCTDNWCVEEEDSILTYPPGSGFQDYECPPDQEHDPFDVWKCSNPEEIIETCKDHAQVIACQIEECIGNQDPDVFENITNVNNTKPEDDILQNPNVTGPEYGDCTNLGSGLSGSTGVSGYSLMYPYIMCIFNGGGGFSVGYDNSLSVLVGGSFTCKSGAGFEGRGVFAGDVTIEKNGCERLAATAHGSLIHPVEDSVCIEVGGSLSVESNFTNSKYIMYEYGNSAKTCHLKYKDGCSINGETCPHSQTDLEEQYLFTNGDFVNDPAMDLSRWEEELTLLGQKVNYWKSLDPNGVINDYGNVIILAPGEDNNPVQIFDIGCLGDDVAGLVFNKNMFGKTIMIRVKCDSEFVVPSLCYYPIDSMPNDQPICGRDSFPPEITTSTVWVFESESDVVISGYATELHGSVVKPFGSLTMSVAGHSGRLIVGGDLIIDGEYTELHNYEFDPQGGPLPLGDDIDEICEVAPPPPCAETYKVLTGDTVCPSKPDGVVKLLKASAELPEGEPVLYDIQFEAPTDGESSHTVKFKVDNPFANHTDIFIKHVKKVGKYALDPTCESMPFTAGCVHEAPTIEVGCHEYEGVEPFALVNVYFASNTDSMVMDIGSGGDVTIDKCCKPPAEYEAGYGVIEYTFEISCVCPDGVADS